MTPFLVALFYTFAVIEVVFGLVVARRALTRPVRPQSARPPLRASIVIPCDCQDPASLRENLRRFLGQDHPDFELVCVTRAPDAALADMLRRLSPRCKYVVAGSATTCCQKNHNILSALARVAADSEAFVFCDADARPDRPSWLRDFLSPLQTEDATVAATTTFRRVRLTVPPSTAAIVYKGYADCQRAALLGFSYYLWGGATALRREMFEQLGVARIWRRSIVDDISLAMLLRSKGLRSVFLTDCMLDEADDESRSMRPVYEWMVRQYQYMKHCAPDGYVLGLVYQLPPALASVLLLTSPVVPGVPTQILVAAATLLAAAAIGVGLRSSGYDPRYRLLLMIVAGSLHPVSFSAGLVSLFRSRMVWGGKSYRIGWGGRVLGISPAVRHPVRQRRRLPSAAQI